MQFRFHSHRPRAASKLGKSTNIAALDHEDPRKAAIVTLIRRRQSKEAGESQLAGSHVDAQSRARSWPGGRAKTGNYWTRNSFKLHNLKQTED